MCVTRPVSDQSQAQSPQLFRTLRSTEFPWTAERIYLDNASIGPLPERTRRVLDEFTARRTTPYLIDERDLFELLEDARGTIARLINADPGEIALAVNTSFGLNVAALGLPLEPGDTIVVSDREFPANVYPWLQLRTRGVRVDLIPTTAEGWPDEDALLQRVSDRKVKVLAVSQVQFSNGYRVDLKRLSHACRSSDCFLVVDAIQGIGQVPLDVKATPIDILACGCQKWLLSPWGSGFVYVRRELIPAITPAVVGWMSFEGTDDTARLTDYETRLRTDARRYELNTLPFQDLAAMNESVKLLLDLGVERIAAHLDLLKQPILDAARIGELEMVSPTDPTHSSGIVSVKTPRSAESFHRLKKEGIVCSFREGAIRLAPHCYNTLEELEKVATILTNHR